MAAQDALRRIAYVRIIYPKPVARSVQCDVPDSRAVVIRAAQFTARKRIRSFDKIFEPIPRTVELSALGHRIPPAVPLENAPVKNSEHFLVNFEVKTVRGKGEKSFLAGCGLGGLA